MFKIAGRFQFVSLLLVAFFSGIVHAETGKAPDPKAVVLGNKLYEKHCQVCHQKDGVGENPIPWSIRNPEYLTAMPLNETSHAWHHSDEELVKMIREGLRRTNRMPAWKSVLSEKEAYDIVSYIKSLWSPRIIACQGPKHMSCM
ncbi:MAG: c-type cytochrome [Acidiferrobacterales bacterium]